MGDRLELGYSLEREREREREREIIGIEFLRVFSFYFLFFLIGGVVN